MAYLKPSRQKKLLPEDLKYIFNPDIANVELTSIQKPILSIIGQERAIKALSLGVELRKQGYNIFITGLSGTGKFTTVQKMLETLQPECSMMYDYAYVNNFEDEDRPILLKFKAGKAIKFKKDMLRSIEFIKTQVAKTFESEPFSKNKEKLITKYHTVQSKLMGAFEEKLTKDSLTLAQIQEGETVHPEIFAVVGEKAFPVQSLNELVTEKVLTKKRVENIKKKYIGYQSELRKVFKEGFKLNNQLKDEIETLEQGAVKKIVTLSLNELKSKFREKGVSVYLNMVANDILNNIEIFNGEKPSEEELESGLIIDYLKEYEVNIILDNSKQKDCPVIVETSPTYQNLFGSIEKYSDGSGGWFSDFTGIKAGSLLRANGGYLILNAADAYSEPEVWKALKRTLYYGKMEIQDKHSSYQASPSVMKPEPIKLETKVILLGSSYTYSVLSTYEDDFNKIFKVKAEFDSEMKRNDRNVEKYVEVLKRLIIKEKLKEFDSSAIVKVLEYSARYVESKNKLTTRFSYIIDLTQEANYWASDGGEEFVTAYHVTQAYESARERHGLYETKFSEMFDDGTMMIDVSGSRVGQINGLAVYGDDRYAFGKPTRITATVALGNGSIINVEREAGLSGSSHNKGVLVITGYLKGKFGKNIPLSFNASLVFEQGYGLIDGDSASITEITALLSAMTEIPIKQSFAITGSVNQKGDIQPIGGVNEKVEGFYDLCKTRGLTGKEGVIIPIQNVQDLMLKDEVVKAVKEKKFSIYAISKVEEALELLMGVKAGKKLASGHYQANTIFGEVEKRLKEMRRKVTPAKQLQNDVPNSKRKNIKRKK
ncbi:MAG: AAA family ATPase [Melioribacteraceae bacterium]|nr:AAA family ATPase [Melioribacteraceae bacterium]